MMRKSSLFAGFAGLLSLVIFTGCDWCKKCQEAPKAEAAASATATETTAPSVAMAIDNKEEFEKEILKSDKLVVVDFYADFCGACKEMKPVFEEIANTMKDKCKFAIVGKEKAEEVFTSQKIEGVPTFIIYKDGQEQARFSGAMSKEDLTKKIEDALEDHE